MSTTIVPRPAREPRIVRTPADLDPCNRVAWLLLTYLETGDCPAGPDHHHPPHHLNRRRR
jgi:hypothetical protein